MESEVLPAVGAYIEGERLAGRSRGITEALKLANVDVQTKGEQFEWAWRRRGMTSAITIWAETVLPVDSTRWISVEQIDNPNRRSGKPWQPLERPRAERRFAITREAFRSRAPLLGFLQINRWSLSDLALRDRTSEVAVRVQDRVPWHVVGINETRKLAVFVRGEAPWEPNAEQIEAALALYEPREASAPAPRPPAPFAVMTAPILVVNIAWMQRYNGPASDDPVVADNFRYFWAEGHPPSDAHEQWQFAETDGNVYGYVPRSSQIAITRIGAEPGDDHVGGVLVVFISRDPAENVLKVVGWYENATVYRREVFTHDRGILRVKTGITAAAEAAIVLPVADRRIVIPTAQREPGGVGQSPLWYGEQHPEKLMEVRNFIASYRRERVVPSPAGRSRGPRQPDLETRLKVEKAAMELAMAYFDGAVDVSKEARGWDIEARDSRGPIFVEVKGLSGQEVAVELTPNEFAKLDEHKERYVLFIVTGALTQARQGRVFRFDAKQDAWISGQGERLAIAPIVGARCTLA